MSSLVLKNPHSVLAALKSRPQDVLQIYLGVEKPSTAWSEVVTLAQKNDVPVKVYEGDNFRAHTKPHHKKKQSPARAGGKFERGSPFSALLKPKPSVSLKELFSDTGQKEGRLWIALDQVQDPHNVGAIFRTASFFGCEGVLLTEDRAASLTGTVYDVASGGVESLPFAIETNLVRSLESAKENFDVWAIGTSEHARESLQALPKERNWMLVLGNEESGLREKVSEACDYLVRIPMQSTSSGEQVSSLNVSVAMGVFSFYLKNR